MNDRIAEARGLLADARTAHAERDTIPEVDEANAAYKSVDSLIKVIENLAAEVESLREQLTTLGHGRYTDSRD